MKAKIILLMVTSINGYITNQENNNIYNWTSKEDSEIFFKTIKKSKLIIMGANTYLTNRSKMKLHPQQLRIVLTHNPDKFKNYYIPNQLEFTADSPENIIKKYLKKYKEILLVGGSQINALFLKSSLIDEIHLTLEPLIFGQGINLIHPLPLISHCRLVKIKKLNSIGSLHLIYQLLH